MQERTAKSSPKKQGRTRKHVTSTSQANATTDPTDNTEASEADGDTIGGVNRESDKTTDLNSPLRRSARVRRSTQV